ncbi:hypothetical protein FIE12Z_3951 [Fusarium flagelliforme]|uniref:C2H2-type domain-containing protein n=1 Tax=Fusarium flagelliforme TaxID=2675880 RepID=A0A395MUY2_9HYPO|nr:hypothetical protein FIE12Z_3951 [Fusarium flagelliforme]
MWTGVSDEKSNGRVKCDPTLGRSAFPDRNPTVYIPLGFRKSEVIQRMAGSPAPGQDGLRMQKASASKADVIAAIRLEALIQTAYHVLNSPGELLSLPSTSDLLPRYFSWLCQYCDTHYLHFLHAHAWSNPLCTYPTRLADQQQLGRRNNEGGDSSRRQLYLPFPNNDDDVKLGKPAKLPVKSGATEQCKTSCTEERTFEVSSECSSRQENKASPVYNAVCSPIRIFNDILSLSEAIQSFHAKQRSVNAMRELAESEGFTAVNIILPHLRTAAKDSEQDGEAETQRIGTSSTQGQNDHGRSVQKHHRNATWPSVVGKKRSTNAEDSSDDDDDEKRPRKIIAQNENSPKFACPYYKYNPHRFSSERSCSGPGWPNMQRLKYGYFDSTMPPKKIDSRLNSFCLHKAPDHQCPRCLMEFENNLSKMQHCQAQEICNVGQSPSTTGLLDENKMRLLKQRGKTTASESEKWFSVYKILFPNETSFPSPYYEQKEKRPEPPPRAVAQEMFRENLDGVLSRWGLVETPLRMDMHVTQVMNLMKSGAIAAFDETLSALYNQRVDSPLDDRTPATAASGSERKHDEECLRPLMSLDTTECALTRCSGSDFNTDPGEPDVADESNLQMANMKVHTAPVSGVVRQTIEPPFWQLQQQASPVSLQHQVLQQQQSHLLPQQRCHKAPRKRLECSLCGAYFWRYDNFLAHQREICCDRSRRRSVRKSTLASYRRKGRAGFNIGTPTLFETPTDQNTRDGRPILNSDLPDVGLGHNDVLNDGQGIASNGNVDRLQVVVPNFSLPSVGFNFEQPGGLNTWHSGLGSMWCPNHDNASSQVVADNLGFDADFSMRGEYNDA